MGIIDKIKKGGNIVKWTAKIELMSEANEDNRDWYFRQKKHFSISSPDMGGFYTYLYDALYKEQLPVWDTLPFICFIGATDNGWYGLNVHHIPWKERKGFLLWIARKFPTFLDGDANALITWGIVKNTPFGGKIIRRYRADRVRSKIYEVEPQYIPEGFNRKVNTLVVKNMR